MKVIKGAMLLVLFALLHGNEETSGVSATVGAVSIGEKIK